MKNFESISRLDSYEQLSDVVGVVSPFNKAAPPSMSSSSSTTYPSSAMKPLELPPKTGTMGRGAAVRRQQAQRVRLIEKYQQKPTLF